MSNPWSRNHRASALLPPPLTSGDDRNSIPPLPPDPPDLVQYPPLSPSISVTPQTSRRSSLLLPAASPLEPASSVSDSETPDTEMILVDSTAVVLGPTENSTTLVVSRSEGTVATRSENTIAVKTSTENYTILKPKFSSPLHTNRASSSPPAPLKPTFSTTPQTTTVNHFDNLAPILSPPPTEKPHFPSSAHALPPFQQTYQSPNPKSNQCPSPNTNPNPNPNPSPSPNLFTAPNPTLAEKIRRSEDKTLKRLAPLQFSETGRPRVLIPDEVFKKGADLHKDFIVCYFKGRPPPYSHIQSVLNHMWGKGKRLEIHNNPNTRSVLWTSAHSDQSPSLQSIQIWAHLHGVPLDLRHTDGLSFVAGLVGEPKETDDFTKNLVSLTLSHVKVEVDLMKPLPSIVEFTRQSGEVVEVLVTYPWLPPTCTHCKELGHIVKNCLHIPLTKSPPLASKEKTKTQTKEVDKSATPTKTDKPKDARQSRTPTKQAS
ncbi:unnamed protein product, partial [Brassica rapa subsp. trilocularis]